MKRLFDSGYFLNPVRGGDGAHVLGGRCDLPGAVSPNSGRPLLQLAALGVDDGALECASWRSAKIHLLYSWSCAICEGPFVYSQYEQGIEIIQYNAGPAYDDFPYPNYPDAFPPVAVGLEPLSSEEQEIIRKLNALSGEERFELADDNPELSRPRHQIGGEPYLLQPHTSTACPVCRKPMSLLGAIANDDFSDQQGFMGNDYAQLVYEVCTSCSTISVSNYAD